MKKIERGNSATNGCIVGNEDDIEGSGDNPYLCQRVIYTVSDSV